MRLKSILAAVFAPVALGGCAIGMSNVDLTGRPLCDAVERQHGEEARERMEDDALCRQPSRPYISIGALEPGSAPV